MSIEIDKSKATARTLYQTMKISTLVALLASIGVSFGLEYTPADLSSLSKSSFFDQLDYESLEESGWVVTRSDRSDGTPYEGVWSLEESKIYPGYQGDKGLVMKTEAAFYGISKKLPSVFNKANQDLVFQYEVKFQETISCCGAYVKLLSSNLNPANFSDDSPYEVLFGPDICGSQNSVYFIIRKDVGGEVIESKLRTPPMAKNNQLTNLYTLVIRKNNDVEIRINGQVAKAGNILNTANFMVPPLSVPELIPDESAVQPEDWDDRRYIFDSTAQKPEDWDETFGLAWIPNPDVAKPPKWNDDENESEYVKNPDAIKPAEWDEEEDGEWNAPMIRNPKCIYGCGKWEAPKIVNKNYKGQWNPPAIENPNYQGEWKPPLVKNPEFAAELSELINPIDAIGVEVWSMNSGIMFNNFYFGSSIEEAELLGNSTFIPKLELEFADYELNKPKARHQPKPPPQSFDDMLDDDSVSQLNQFLEFIKVFYWTKFFAVKDLWHEFEREPIPFITAHPIKFALSCFLFLFIFTIVFGVVNVAFFVFMSKPESVSSVKSEKEKPKIEELTEDEMIAQITGKSTGAKVGDTEPQKRAK